MKKILALSIAALALLAVSCNKEIAPESGKTVSRTLSVTAPEGTKTELDGMSVLWSEGDQIRVMAMTTGNAYNFTLKSGAGSASAIFEGELEEEDAEETDFVAVYPNVTFKVENGLLKIDNNLNNKINLQKAVKDGFDPNFAIMYAKSGTDGRLAFRHGTAFFKIKVGRADVKDIKVYSHKTDDYTNTEGTRFYGRPDFDIAEDQTYAKAINGAANSTELSPVGEAFEEGATYYIPVLVKKTMLNNLTVVYQFTDNTTATITTDKKAEEYLEMGKVYDLGCPALNPPAVIKVKDVTIDADPVALGDGKIPFEIINPIPGYGITAARESEATWLGMHSTDYQNNATSGNLFYYINTANPGPDARSTTITFSYYDLTDNTKVAASAVMTFTQRAPGAVATHFLWDFSSDEWVEVFEANFTAINNNQTVSFSYDGLDIVGNGSLKYNVHPNGSYFIQMAGKGSTTQRAFHFTAPESGTLSVWATNTGDSEDLTRTVDVVVGSAAAIKKAGGYAKKDGAHQIDYDISAGEVYIFSSVNGLCYYKIEFTGL
jgi:hypothetical protein